MHIELLLVCDSVFFHRQCLQTPRCDTLSYWSWLNSHTDSHTHTQTHTRVPLHSRGGLITSQGQHLTYTHSPSLSASLPLSSAPPFVSISNFLFKPHSFLFSSLVFIPCITLSPLFSLHLSPSSEVGHSGSTVYSDAAASGVRESESERGTHGGKHRREEETQGGAGRERLQSLQYFFAGAVLHITFVPELPFQPVCIYDGKIEKM